MVKSQKTPIYSSSTLRIPKDEGGGKDLGEEEKVWRGVAASEVRIGMMRIMIKQKIAFADLEELKEDF